MKQPADDVKVLTTALSAIGQTRIDGIKFMTNDLDNVMLVLKSEFDKQKQLCKDFQNLASLYRPLRMDAVATVVSLKDFADTTYKMLIPMLKNALDDGSVKDTKQVIDELVDTFLKVHKKMQGLKVQHNDITRKACQLGQKAATMAQQHSQEKKKLESQGDKAGVAAAGGGVGVGAAAITMLCVGAGPIGWTLIGAAAAVTTAGAVRLDSAEGGRKTQHALSQSAEKINVAMSRITSKLDEQLQAMTTIVTALEGARNSTAQIQNIIDAWHGGNAKSKMHRKRIEMFVEKFPDDMVELSQYCHSYLGDDSKNQRRIMDAMKF